MIVDDSPIMRRLLEYMLQNAGYEVMVANDGPEALALLAQARPDAMFLDIMMPNMDGLQVLEQIRQDNALSDLPVIMLTAKAQDADRNAALRAGANEYLTKPYTSEQVLNAVQRYIDRPAD